MKKVGFLADTHSAKPDGSDLPDKVLEAFAGVDLIVHLGDVGRKGILDRLAAVAPVLVPVGGNKGYVPASGEGEAVYVLDTGKTSIGLTFNLAQPDKKISVGDTLEFAGEPSAKLFKRRFKQEHVDVVAFAGTHTQMEQVHDGVLFLNPGSPTLPMPGHNAGVAILNVAGPKPRVKFAVW